MSTTRATLVVALGLLALGSLATLAAGAESTELADGPGRDLTIGRCVICHSLDYLPSNAPAMNRAGWQKSIQKMRDKFGAPITDEEATEILGYLDTHYSGKAP
ncbi:MAG TPA: hypothetical protein VEH54_00095 [Steroidobacteraceae bacterium]|nr:hypothetical protein [Steroidobacteraceae bacterium]